MFLLAGKVFSAVQHDTSAAKNKFRPLFFNVKDFENFKTEIKTFDTSLYNINFINPVRKNNLSFQDLGLPGTPIKIFTIEKYKNTGFDLGFNNMNLWLFETKAGNDKIIYAPTPYSNLNYSQGEKELIFIEANHTQNIRKRLNAGIDYRRLKTNNYLFYNFDEQTYDRIRIPSIFNFKIYTSFHSKNDRFYLLGNAIFNKSTLTESGGLKYPEMFDTTSGKLRAFENNLTNATNSIKQYGFAVKTYYRFGKIKYLTKAKDSSKVDTTGFEFAPKSYIFHNIHFSKTDYKYFDPNADTPYYKSTFFGKNLADSIVLKELNNSIGFALNSKNIIFKTGAELSNYGVFNNFYGQLYFYNFSLKSTFDYRFVLKYFMIKTGAIADYFLVGFNKKDYLLRAFINLKYKNKTTLKAEIFSQEHTPEYVQSIFHSNHAIWNQNLSKTKRNGISSLLYFENFKTKVSITACNYENYILYYKDAAPAGVDFNYLNADLENKFNFKKIFFVNRFIYQKASKTYNVPEFSLNGQVYFESFLFKKNMFAQIGFDYSWYSSFYADFYVPYLKQFVWQNQTQTGNYPYFGAFVRARIQTVNVFLKYEHINQSLLKSNYYSTYLYPNVPRFYSLGINWRLFY